MSEENARNLTAAIEALIDQKINYERDNQKATDEWFPTGEYVDEMRRELEKTIQEVL